MIMYGRVMESIGVQSMVIERTVIKGMMVERMVIDDW